MKRWRRLTCLGMAAAGVAVLGLLAGGPGVAWAGEPGGLGPHVHVINLHAAYEAHYGHIKAGKIAITYARGKQVRAASILGTCAESDCPLVYQGGPVQHSPHVYLLFWGPTWSTDAGEQASAGYLKSFCQGLGVQSQDDWSTTTSQYGDGSGDPAFSGTVCQGFFQDTSTPPYGVDQAGLAAEADAFASHEGITDLADAQIVIATESGTCPSGFYAPECNGGTGSYCAWHSSSNEPYTNLPYILDAGSGCGEGFVNSPGTYDGFSIVEGHEYAETITDPYPTSGWWDPADSSGGEIGDKCAWSPLSADVSLSTGSFAMQPLYSNSAYNANSGSDCVMSTTPPTPTYSLSVSKSGTGATAGTVTSSPSGINCGSTCSANYASGTAVMLTATPASGTVFTGWSGACTGMLTVCTVTMNAAESATASFASSATLSVSKSGTGASAGTVTSSPSGINCGSTCSANYASGTAVMLTATPASGAVFTGWSGACTGMLTACTVTMNAAKSVTASFTASAKLYQETAAAYQGTWKLATCACYSGGAARYSTAAGPSASFSFTGSLIQFVSERGLTRGSFRIYVNGALMATVSNYSTITQNAVIVWQKRFTAVGKHTVKIVNVGTSGHPRVDVDAFVVGT
jgi:hypothetical protein